MPSINPRSPLVALVVLAGCGGSKPVVYTFDDSAVKPMCACTRQTPLASSDVLGERTVQSQQEDLARTWQGTLYWREQPWFTTGGETALSLRFTPRYAFAASCPTDPEADCGVGRYAVFMAELHSADELLNEQIELRMSYLPEAVVNASLRRPAGLWSRRKDAREPDIMLAMFREGGLLKGKVYVRAPEAGPDSEVVESIVGEWEAAPVSQVRSEHLKPPGTGYQNEHGSE